MGSDIEVLRRVLDERDLTALGCGNKGRYFLSTREWCGNERTKATWVGKDRGWKTDRLREGMRMDEEEEEKERGVRKNQGKRKSKISESESENESESV